jgi:branched-chain amino acid transport system ATP-binding protein
VDSIFENVKQMHAAGVTILLVEQNARIALQAASRGYVLQTGTIFLADTAANLQKNEMVRKVYMGEA